MQDEISFLKNLFAPYTQRIYIVGGTLRNHFLNTKITNKDIDIEVHSIDLELFDKLMSSIDACGVGKSFFVYKYNNIDISLGRVESKVSYGHNGFKVKIAKDEKQASIRRDFTMNALMYNIFTNEILDFHNGISDIEDKTIKVVNNISFIEDSLRVLRAIRFASCYNLRIKDSSLKLMMTMDISDLSNHRIYKELKQIFVSPYLEIGLYYLIKTDVLKRLFNIDITFKDFITIYKYMKKHKAYFNEDMKDYYFLYILQKYTNLDIDNFELPKRYRFIKNEPILDDIDDEELLYIATFKPIEYYLDSLNISIINRAKKLNIYDERLELSIDIQEILDSGYKGIDISLQIKKNKKELIRQLI